VYRENLMDLLPLAIPLAPSAILLPPITSDALSARAPVGENPCAALTPAAIQQLINKVAESLGKADSDVTTNGTAGSYAIAAVYNKNYLADVEKNLLFLQSWLSNLGLDAPFVTNASGAYNIHGYVRDAVSSLHYARHWATISVVYHKSPDAFDSVNLTSEAIELAEKLGEHAGLCYIRDYFP
jgi:hypothetical protein